MNNKPPEIYENIYRVGSEKRINDLLVNTYLMVDGEEGVLFGAGSAADFNSTFAAVTDILPVERLKYIVLQSPDSAVCSAIPLFEKNGFSGKIVTHWRTGIYIKYYDISSDFLYSNLTANRLILKSGRMIHFINTPYLKSAGSIAAYDPVSKILFSGDLFGAFSKNGGLNAGDNHIELLKKYHAENMPGDHIFRNVLGVVSKRETSIIAPHYGAVINRDIPDIITELRNIRCGVFFSNIKIDTACNDETIGICNDLLKQYFSLFPGDEVLEVFSGSSIVIDEKTGRITGCDSEITDLWNYFFKVIVSRKGMRWLSLIEDLLEKTVTEYNLDLPEVLRSSLSEAEQKYEKLEKEKASLLETLRAIEREFQIPENVVMKDPLAQVYKEDVFKDNLMQDIIAYRDIGIDFAFFIIEVDNLDALNVKYGREAGDEILANTAYLLKNFKKASKTYAHHLIFRMNGPRFTYYCNDISREEVITIAENIRTEFRESKLFITDITVSVGLIHSGEFPAGNKDPEDLMQSIVEVANSRLRLAKHRGTDTVCSDSETTACYEIDEYIMIIDPDISIRYMLETHLKNAGFNVITCSMGDEALEQIDLYKPQVIISGIMLPKIDGFSLRKKLLEDSDLKDIPFIIMSSVKDEKSIIRAQSLGIYHYFKKPFSIVELLGLVKNLSKEAK